MKKSILLVPAICYTMIAGGVKPFNGRYILVKMGSHSMWYEAFSVYMKPYRLSHCRYRVNGSL